MRLERIPLVELDGAPGVTLGALDPGASPGHVRVDVAVLAPGSSLPRHPAGREQVFYVVAGHGRVAGGDDVAVGISAGWAATWEAGEVHTSWADSEMTVLIVQRRPLDVEPG